MTATISDPVKYIAELFRNMDFDPRCGNADNVHDRIYDIYNFSVAEQVTDVSNYWIAWGGYYDNPEVYGIQIFFNFFLTEVFSSAAMLAMESSFWIDKTNDIVYMHLPRAPWLFSRYYTGFYESTDSTFSSAPKNVDILSDNTYDEKAKAEVKLRVPSISNQLNDLISGIKFYNEYEIKIDNTDGSYDDYDVLEFFNTPMQLLKSSDNAQSIEDFNKIQYGIINNINVDYDSMVVRASDVLFTLNSDYCNKFSDDEFENIDTDLIDENIPIAWGPVYDVELFEVDREDADPVTWIDYIAIDKLYLTSVEDVYDSDGNSLTHTYSISTGIIRVTETDDDGSAIEAETADVTGKSNNKISEIIIEALDENERLPYVEGVWDTTETDAYDAVSYTVGYYFDGGTTRDLIEGVLRNDLVFLIQKNDGRLTLRRWDDENDTHTISSWQITKKPKKNFENSYRLFCSSVRIMSEPKHNTNDFRRKTLNETREDQVFFENRRSFTANFETDLEYNVQVGYFSERLLDRFSTLRETLSIGVGVDTFDVNLLDTISLDVTINGRVFSDYTRWRVVGINPGQDEIIIEGIDGTFVLTFDDDFATLDNDLWEVRT